MVDFDLEENHIWVWSWPWLFIYLLAHFPWDLATLLSFHLMLYIRTFLLLFSGNLSPIFFALHHCLCPPMRPCLFWSQMIMSDLTALLARNFVAHLLGHLLAHLPSYWVALLPRYLVSKSYLLSPSQLILDAFFKYSVNQDNQAKRYIEIIKIIK